MYTGSSSLTLRVTMNPCYAANIRLSDTTSSDAGSNPIVCAVVATMTICRRPRLSCDFIATGLVGVGNRCIVTLKRLWHGCRVAHPDESLRFASYWMIIRAIRVTRRERWRCGEKYSRSPPQCIRSFNRRRVSLIRSDCHGKRSMRGCSAT